MKTYFDIHSHLDYPEYQSDFPLLMNRMAEEGVRTITVGTDLASAQRAVALAEKYNNIWACIGIHPADNHKEIWNESEFEKLVCHPKVVAVGECGLDFFRLPVDEETKELDLEKVSVEKKRQQELFEHQITFAIKYDKTLMIHCREAYHETYDILQRYKKEFPQLRIHLHFFAGDMEIAKKFLELDATFSFTGVITFTHQYDEVIRFLPLEKIMSETDAPFVAPVPYRGKRNEPTYVVEVVKKMAEIKGISVEELNLILVSNAKKIFSTGE